MNNYTTPMQDAIYILILFVIFFGTIIAVDYICDKIEEKENTVAENNTVIVKDK